MCSVTVKEEESLKVFENEVLRKIFGLQEEEVTVCWRKLHNEELNHLFASSNVIRETKHGDWDVRDM
jgi:hypothetical protein